MNPPIRIEGMYLKEQQRDILQDGWLPAQHCHLCGRGIEGDQVAWHYQLRPGRDLNFCQSCLGKWMQK